MSERMIWDALDEGRDPTESGQQGSVTDRCCRGGYPSMKNRDNRAHEEGPRRRMSSATVLDSIIEGVRADVAAREAVVSLAEIKADGQGTRRRRWT